MRNSNTKSRTWLRYVIIKYLQTQMASLRNTRYAFMIYSFGLSLAFMAEMTEYLKNKN